jgi:hypothetical protein
LADRLLNVGRVSDSAADGEELGEGAGAVSVAGVGVVSGVGVEVASGVGVEVASGVAVGVVSGDAVVAGLDEGDGELAGSPEGAAGCLSHPPTKKPVKATTTAKHLFIQLIPTHEEEGYSRLDVNGASFRHCARYEDVSRDVLAR